MKNVKYIVMLLVALFSACTEADTLSPDINNNSMLPDRGDYLNQDYGTQALADEISGVYDSSIGLIIYDDKTRTKPIMYLTRGETDILIKPLESGAVEISYIDFQTIIMPLKMSVTIKGLLEKRNDTIFIRGTDGKVRTRVGEDMPIGTPLPESDDAELIAEYIIKENELKMFIDFMLPVAIKGLVRAKKY